MTTSDVLPTRTLSPVAMARNECACHLNDGSHYGAWPCLVGKGQRCTYFEKAVLPVADWFPQAYAECRDRYWSAAGEPGRMVGATVRHCECGEVLPPRKRLCARCRRLRRQTTYREAARKSRSQQLDPKSSPQVAGA